MALWSFCVSFFARSAYVAPFGPASGGTVKDASRIDAARNAATGQRGRVIDSAAGQLLAHLEQHPHLSAYAKQAQMADTDARRHPVGIGEHLVVETHDRRLALHPDRVFHRQHRHAGSDPEQVLPALGVSHVAGAPALPR